MKFTRKQIFQKVIAMLMVIIITIADFSVVGESTISYAIDMVKTNNDNVEFFAYFINSNNESVTEIDSLINQSNLKLYVEIDVKHDGYFNGEIELGNSSFKFKQDNSSEYVKRIEDSRVILNKIDSETKVRFELGIEYKNSDTIFLSSLNQENELNLKGIYVNSKRNKEIKGTTKVRVNWKKDENAKSNLDAKILTNNVYEIDGINKKVVQILVNSNLNNDIYPIKNTQIVIEAPENIEEYFVYAKNTSATNKEIDFNENNYEFIKESNLLVIDLQNNEKEGMVNWAKNQKDSFVITYIYPENIELQDKKINVNSVIYPYDESKITNNKEIKLNEKADGLVNIDIENKENSIYKGNLYVCAKRDYEQKLSINVNYYKAIDNIKIDANEALYTSNDGEYKANILFKTTRINKQELINVLGEEFNLAIFNQAGVEEANITKDTNSDENGNIVIDYSENVDKIILKTNAPKANGTINLYNTKTIIDEKLKTDDIKSIKGVKENFDVIYNNQLKNNKINQIELKETSMKTKFEINKNNLNTASKNEGVILTATLLTNGENKKLYKNPQIEIKLPKEISNIDGKVQYRILNGNGLKENKITVDKSNNVIKIALKGEQKEYTTESVEGTIIQIRFNCTLNKLSTNKKADFNLIVKNEFSDSKEENKVSLDIINPQRIIKQNTINGHKEIKVGVKQGRKQEEVKIQVINNEQKTIKDVNILGTLPTNSKNNNMGISLNSGIHVNSKNSAKVYYTEKEQADENIENKDNKWETKITSKSKNFLIIIDEMEQSDKIDASYEINIPSNLKYNLKAEEGFVVKYNDSLTSSLRETEEEAVILTTGVEAEIKQSVKAYVNGKELQENGTVKSGEIIKYEISLENTGSIDVEDIKVQGTIPQGTKRVVLKEVRDEDSIIISSEGDQDVGDVSGVTYEELEDEKVVFEGINLKSGEKTKLSYEVRVNSNVNDNTPTNSQIKTTYNGKEVKDEFNFTINTASLVLTMTTVQRVPGTIKSGYGYDYSLSIINNSNDDKENIKVKLNNNELLRINEISYDYEDKMIYYNNEEAKQDFTIAKIKAGEEIKVLISTTAENCKEDLNYAEISANVIDSNNNMYYSNIISEKVDTIKLNLDVRSTTSSQTGENYLVAGDKITYNILVKNTGNVDANDLIIKNKISNYLTVNSIKVDGKDVNYNKNITIEGENSYIVLDIDLPLKSGESANIAIETTVNNITSNDILKISNKVLAINNITIAETEGNTYLLQNKNINTTLPDEFGEDENGNQDGQKSSQNNYSITGTVWFDEDKDGQRNLEESKLDSINVHLLDVNTNIIIQDVQTDEEGFYSFTNIPEGKYIVLFEYDSSEYIPTLYKAEGVQGNKNSDAIQGTFKINNETRTIAKTEALSLTNNLSNIDLGLIKAEKFDLELYKYVNKISVVNSSEAKTNEFNKSGMAKIEIAAKDLSNSDVVVEYIIEVRNNGEVPGVVESIVDYKSNALEFSSSLNKDWYQSGNNIYNDSLKATEIKPGETKEIKLILSKKMTESNTGLINNTAEIAKAYNMRGIADTDSVPRNNETEDDLGTADVIISVKTGAAVSYIALTISLLIIIATAAYLINNKILKGIYKF